LSDDSSRQATLKRIARAARHAQGRARVMAALDGLFSTLAVALLAVATALTLSKVVPGFSPRIVADVIAAAVAAALGAAVYTGTRPLPKFAGAMALDTYHGLSDRLSSALSFAALPARERTPLMELAIEDACEKARALSPGRAVPLRWPRDLGVTFGLLAGLLLLAALHVPAPRALSQAKTIDPVVLAADDIDLFRQVGQELTQKDKSPEVLTALRAYNQLVEDIAQQRLDRTEAFRRMHEIESRLSEGRGLDPKALDEQLKMRAAALKESELSRPLAEALEQQDLAKAEQRMRELAQRLRDKPDSVAKAELERLRQAMKNAAEGQKERLAALERRREELEKELLRRKDGRDGGVSDQEKSLFEKKERELERLDREREQNERQSRQLDRLDRDLQKAAEDLMRELGLSADDLEQGAEDINRLAEEQMSDQEREELRQRLQDLREQMRQAGQGGKERLARLRRFVRQARGQGQGPGEDEGQGQESQGRSQAPGKGFGQQADSDPMLQIMRGQGQAQVGQGEGQGPEQGQGQGAGKDPRGDKTGDPGHTVDVQATALDTGQGASRSQAILGAAERGFRGGAYKKVYTEYRTSAEEQIHQDKIPPGGSEHVRRYFDLIRPRE
jgi:hypothetical protein